MDETAGNVSESQRDIKFEWEIKNFLMLGERLNRYKSCSSPVFSFYGASWKISILPHGEENGKPVLFGLFLEPVSLPKPVTMTFSLGLKTVEGESDSERTETRRIDERGWGWRLFISRLDLIYRKDELLPSGTLTVICTLKNSTSNVTGLKDKPHNPSPCSRHEGNRSQSGKAFRVRYSSPKDIALDHEVTLNRDSSSCNFGIFGIHFEKDPLTGRACIGHIRPDGPAIKAGVIKKV